MATPYLGSLMLVSFSFAPKGFALCNGQTLPINQNQALFSLLGTQYGGNGVNTFALPNLQSRVAIGTGTNAGNSFTAGQIGGAESVVLNVNQIPSHTHTLTVSSAVGGVLTSPVGNTVGASAGVPFPYAASSNDVMAAGSISAAGGSQPHENRSPYLTLNWVIALTGIFPSRS